MMVTSTLQNVSRPRVYFVVLPPYIAAIMGK